ncbi:ATP-binding protein [Pyruvatibacter mobilis]|uniref:ATP-binding protein n=1 Tax=Pyruvatibacter mobilis TaxID=1712261 RepID=UPI003BAC8B58
MADTTIHRTPARRFLAAIDPSILIKDWTPRGLFGRSLIIVVAPMLLLQIVATSVFLDRHWEKVTRGLAYMAANDMALIMRLYDDISDDADYADFVDRIGSTIEVQIAIWPGESLPPKVDPGWFPFLHDTLETEMQSRFDRPVWVDTVTYEKYVDVRVQVPEGVVRALFLRSRVSATNSHIFLSWMAGTSLILLVVAILFLRGQVRPIQRLAQAAEAFGLGRDMPNFKPSGATEVRRAAQALIVMRDRLARQIQQRTAMLAGVSHDLKTPLTRFKLQLAMMGDDPDIKELQDDVVEMQRLLDEYLDFARGQGGETAREVELEDFLEDVRVNAARKGTDIELVIDGPMPIRARPHALKRCITNLVENAAGHADHVRLAALRRGAMVEITVDDDGPGIPADQMEDAFRPFHRLDESRNQNRSGSGLGLAIARDVARGHGGDILLLESPLGGLRALVQIPV